MLKKNLLIIHKWLGLIAGIFILIMGLTGSALVFDDEIEHFLQRDVIHQPDSNRPVSLDNAYASIREAYPNWDVRIKLIPDEATRSIEAEVRRPDARRTLYIHPATGEILRDLDSNKTFSHWMLKLHYQLHSGFFGEIVLLIVGFMFICSLLTGFWFYRKAVRRVLTFKIRPRFRDLKSGSSELHRSVGVWALVFNLVTAVTGTFILLTIVVSHAEKVDKPEPIPNPPPVEVSLDRLLEKAEKAYAGFDPSYISMPTKPEGGITLYGHMDTDLLIHYEFSNYVQFNPKTGTESSSFFIKNKPWYVDLYSFMYPLHFGNWGGTVIKILYSLFGMAPALLSISGFIIWRQRQKQKQELKRKRRQIRSLSREQKPDETKTDKLEEITA
ncbi:MAG TPA: PepSY-associated TM helix domain-containing protein [Fodinibius sp.]|nr:PepSY-associated TM helix domain-containing protein [Fodinibius sp.]